MKTLNLVFSCNNLFESSHNILKNNFKKVFIKVIINIILISSTKIISQIIFELQPSIVNTKKNTTFLKCKLQLLLV